MLVTYIQHMGDDLTTVNAARVSFSKEAEWVEGDEVQMPNHWLCIPDVSEKDRKLINYLAKHKHWTPFGHSHLTVRVKAPVFVARQLFKHKVGLTENEVSRRYVDDEPEFWMPHKWRKKAENKKQGSEGEHPEQEYYDEYLQRVHDFCGAAYEDMIKSGIAPEQARAVLPQSMYTEWFWSGSLSAFARVYTLRTDEHAQEETGEIAKQIGEICGRIWPVSWGALTDGN